MRITVVFYSRIRLTRQEKIGVLLVDLSNCSAAEVGEIARAVPRVGTAQPPASVLILADFCPVSARTAAPGAWSANCESLVLP